MQALTETLHETARHLARTANSEPLVSPPLLVSALAPLVSALALLVSALGLLVSLALLVSAPAPAPVVSPLDVSRLLSVFPVGSGSP